MADFKKNRPGKFLQDLDNSDYLSIFDDISDGVIVANADGVIVYYNRSMSLIDELDPDNVIFRKLTDVYDLDDNSSIIMQCLSKQKPIIDEPIYYRTRMGKFANTIHNAMPIFSKNKLVGVICFIRDYHALSQTIASMPLPGKDQQFDNASITFDRIIGKDPVFVDAINFARMASSTPSPVMLFGETGTGKELFARAIHNHSSREAKKYTPVNCAAIPENLLEGILFGTSKGAFTGSIDKAGLFERTDKGTIFLDEVNSMPIGLQTKILRSIQERSVRRVGALEEIEIDLKIISSVNKDPHISISDGTLRSDLFYRLGVVFIHIVPMRERMGDLGLLVNHFIGKHNIILGKNVKKISNEVMKLFKKYNWPGNVRELEHVIEGAMNIVGTDEVIRSKHLQTHFLNRPLKAKSEVNKKRHDDAFIEDGYFHLIKNTSDHEKNIVENALLENRGNITKTARFLRISRQLLYYKIKKFNISRN
ncbi:sigma-54 interaction domain-containing protein [Desulfobacula sp.]